MSEKKISLRSIYLILSNKFKEAHVWIFKAIKKIHV